MYGRMDGKNDVKKGGVRRTEITVKDEREIWRIGGGVGGER